MSIEELVLSDPKLAEIGLPDAYSRFIDQLAPRFAVATPFLRVIESPYQKTEEGNFENKEVRIHKFAAAFHTNPADAEEFTEFVRSKLKQSAEDQSVHNVADAIALYGMKGSHDFLTAIELHRLIYEKPFPWNPKTHQPQIKPETYLRMANQAEQVYGEGGKYAHMAFGAGLVYDIIRLFITQYHVERKLRLLDFLEQTFKHGIQTARIALNLSREIKSLELSEYVFAAGLIHDIGKAVMAVFFPDYGEFLVKIQKENLPRSIRVYTEKQKFGFDHAFMSAEVCRHFPMLSNVYSSILFHHDPYFIDRKKSEMAYSLAGVVCLSTNIASEFKRVESPDDPVIQSAWKRPEISDYDISNDRLVRAISRLVQS